MARVFVSYATEDRLLAEGFVAWLRGEGHQVFFDRDAEHGIPVGDDWEQRLYERLRWADAVLCLVTADYTASAWCSAELGIARSLGCRLLPVRSGPAKHHPLLRAVQVVDHDDSGDWQHRIGRTLRGIDAYGGTGWDVRRSPFPGLQPFDTDMHQVFFGRETEINALAAVLRSPPERAGAMTLVIGPSGCGKSSLLRAGLIPRLAAEPGWLALPVFVPGKDPMGSLAVAVAAAAKRLGLDWTATSVVHRLGTEEGFADVVADLLAAAPDGPDGRLLVVVDQVEELLNDASETARGDFARAVSSVPGDRVRLVGSMRLELLASLLADTSLAAVAVRPFAVRPLQRDALPSVIRGPARLAGIGVDEELTERLVADTGDGEALPLLAFTLSELAAGVTRGGHLSAGAYEALGGVRGAVRGRAHDALTAAANATGRDEDEVLAGLLQLIAVDDEGRPARRRVARAELSDQVNAELDCFVARRLLVVDTEADRPVISVAHEAFLSDWPPLSQAIEANAKTLRDRHAVERAANDWAADDDDAQLLRGARLDTARLLLDGGHLSDAGRRFVVAGLDARHRVDRAVRRRRQAWIAAALVGVAVVAASSTAIGVTTAEERAQARRDTTRQLLAEAQANTGSRPETALRWGVTAARFAADTGDAQLRAQAHDGLVATLASSRYLGPVPVDDDVVQFVAGPGGLAATVTATYRVQLRDVPDGRSEDRVTLPDTAGQVEQVFFGPAKDRLTTLASNGPLTVWNIHDLHHPVVVGAAPMDAKHRITAVATSPDGARIFTGDSDGLVSVWSLADPARPAKTGTMQSTTRPSVREYARDEFAISRSRPAVVALAYASDNTLVSSTLDTLTRWDLSAAPPSSVRTADLPSMAQAYPNASNYNNAPVQPLPDAKTVVQLAPDGTLALVGGSTLNNAAAMLVSTGPAGTVFASLPGHAHSLASAAFSHGGRYLATIGADSSVRLWDVRNPSRPVQVGALSSDASIPLAAEFSLGDTALYVWRSDRSIVRYATEGVVSEAHRLTLQADRRLVQALAVLDGAEPDVLSTSSGPNAPRVVATADPKRHLLAVGTRASRTGPFPPSDAEVQLLDTSTDDVKPYATIPDLDTVTALTLSESGRLLAVGTAQGSTFLYNLSDPRNPVKVSGVFAFHAITFPIDMLGLPTEEIAQLAISPDERRLAIGTVGAGVFVYDIRDTARMVFMTRLTEPAGAVHALAFSPDNAVLAAGSGDGVIRVWDAQTTTATGPLAASPSLSAPATALGASPAAATAATGTPSAEPATTTASGRPADRATINPLTLTAALQSTDGGVLALAYDRDSRLLATGASSGAVTLWDNTDPRHPKKLQTFQGPADGVTTVAFASGGEQLLATDGMHTVVTWYTTRAKRIVASPETVACNAVHQGLTRQEWTVHLPRYGYTPTCRGTN
ncbi:TIR domain-containing protein [Dactylosporangium sp. NPDC049525]|uniref:nSTAND1 domain-containing NTPase n=1 Tax=Dactylosporangium sp. NPDC049525 TaxID=3154730 RepID=UPI00342A6CC0